ncbi:helix-turn-helix domain-containing protein [Micromonospora sediminicola]|uniref:helix-turn-helix domain-containing protein n=1 Tax=Micromonospora sediminicola TaxID=946078 RepID=UPI003799F8BC
MKATGRGWAYAGAILGGAASVAANVAHSYIGPDPSALEVAFSIFWPSALFVCVEVLARVAFPRGFGYAALRFVGVSLVALVAAIVSYRHLSGLFEHYGEDPVTVTIGPLAIDGLLAVCSAALILTAHKRALASDAPAAPVPPAAPPVPLYVPAAWTAPAPATPRETPQDAPVSPAPAPSTPEPVPAVLDAPTAPEPTEGATPEEAAEETEPSDPRMVTTLAFGPLPEEKDPERYPEIRRRAEALKAEDQKRSQQNIADLLGIPRWTLRTALDATRRQPTSPPKLELITT